MIRNLTNITTPLVHKHVFTSARTVFSFKQNFVAIFTRWSWIILIVASVLQCVLFQTFNNWISVLYIIGAWYILTSFFLRSSVLEGFPFSTYLIIGYVTTQFYFPLLFTLTEGKPVVFNLEMPLDVFFHSTLILLVLTLAHILYRTVFSNVNRRKNSVLKKMGMFDAPSNLQLWLMGLIGIGAVFYSYIYTNSAWSMTGTASDKFIQSLAPFSYAPFFIFFGPMYGGNKKISRQSIILLILFTVLLFAVSIARNNRSGFILGFTSVGFSYGLGLLLNYFKPQFFTLRNLIIAGIGLWFITGPVADISTAMVIVRGERRNVPPAELIVQTAEAFFDKESIRLYRMSSTDASENRGWDEYYLKNIYLARFCNIKFNDLSLQMASKVSIPDTDMLKYTTEYFLAQFPMPVLNFLGFHIDKEFVSGSSMGDYFYYKVTGDPSALGGYRTGHIAGVSLATFGWWYLAILGIGIIPVFILFDKLSYRRKLVIDSSKQPTIVFSMGGLMIITEIYLFLVTESVQSFAAFLVRGWVQLIILYFLIYQFTRIISSLFTSKKILSA